MLPWLHPTPDADRLTRLLLNLLTDPARTRLLLALVVVDERRVGDLALTLDITN